jgi:hypothetical protein
LLVKSGLGISESSRPTKRQPRLDKLHAQISAKVCVRGMV